VNDACIECGGTIEHSPARVEGTRVVRASWRCKSCGRAGDYARGTTTEGRPFTARVEHTPGAPHMRWTWGPA